MYMCVYIYIYIYMYIWGIFDKAVSVLSLRVLLGASMMWDPGGGAGASERVTIDVAAGGDGLRAKSAAPVNARAPVRIGRGRRTFQGNLQLTLREFLQTSTQRPSSWAEA